MAYKVIEYVTTPNPNAIKIVVEGLPAKDGPRSYRDAAHAAGDPLAAALMAVAGVRNVLLHDGWVSVGKSPEAEWKSLKPALKRVLEGFEGGA
ncbi:hypothetical protein PHYC_00265 [Phycisphaerales bacterium]|nr:hypothetical protein PHYC_00265 [Phycisphaerales bacterium]